MTKNSELRTMLFWVFLFVLTTAALLYSSRPNKGALPTSEQLSPNTLHLKRQSVWVRVDSLKRWLDPLQAQTQAFSWSDEGSKLVFEQTDAKAFAAIFLGDFSLSSYAQLQDPIIKIQKNNDGFYAIVKKEKGDRFVHLPAEVLQSLQRYREQN